MEGGLFELLHPVLHVLSLVGELRAWWAPRPAAPPAACPSCPSLSCPVVHCASGDHSAAVLCEHAVGALRTSLEACQAGIAPLPAASPPLVLVVGLALALLLGAFLAGVACGAACLRRTPASGKAGRPVFRSSLADR